MKVFVFDIFCLTALGFIAQVRSDVLLARDAAAESPYYTTTYQATKTSTWGVPTLVPCPPIKWTNTHSTPVVQTTTVTKTLPGTTAYVTSEITKTIPSYATITETDTFYTRSTLTKTSIYTSWTTATSYTGGCAILLPCSDIICDLRSLDSGQQMCLQLSEATATKGSRAKIERERAVLFTAGPARWYIYLTHSLQRFLLLLWRPETACSTRGPLSQWRSLRII
jgi:hypothetical protein